MREALDQCNPGYRHLKLIKISVLKAGAAELQPIAPDGLGFASRGASNYFCRTDGALCWHFCQYMSSLAELYYSRCGMSSQHSIRQNESLARE
jgi:hypothetical protein